MEKGMVYDIIVELASTDSLKEKENILLKYKNNLLVKDVFRLTYSQRVKFHIKKIPEYEPKTESKTLRDALDFLENVLGERVLTGHAAIAALKDVLESLCPKDAALIKRIVKRDLECGVGRSIPNKVWENLLPKQPQFLAAPFSKANVSKIKFPALAQLKADGARCFAEVVDGEVNLYSRSGSEYLGLDLLKEEIVSITEGLGNVVLDGELVYFPKSTKQGLDLFFDEDEEENIVASREEGNGIANKSIQGTISKTEADCVKFQVWDLINYEVTQGTQTDNSEISKPYEKRLKDLESITKNAERLESIPSQEVKTLEEAQVIYRKYVDMKLEGIILKNKLGVWADGRTCDQVKFKEEKDFDLEIIGAYPHSKDPEKLGGVNLRSRDGTILVDCGSGFKDKDYEKVKGKKVWIPLDKRHELDRRLLWDLHMKGELIGMIISGVCNAAQKVDGRETYSLFLPRVKMRRLDKQEANDFYEIFGQSPEEYFNR
ncbi:ATP-dependent DNA ligase [Proteus phage phiP4-3]|uniref:DNA ligase n=1 Tax=Proteus phage phiP4-3 TaxID=2065203 RepID=A0A2I6PFC8_9CAUD|nr:ATP-dependent DNA ligase [Proteus phage phiP4-3]AUM58424.1 DNA ligase [Proteus phage phiP4-3]